MKKPLKKIAMISTHGYFDPIPRLGKTDTGGQIVYVLELAKILSQKHKIKVDIYTRWFNKSQKKIDPVPNFQDIRVIRIKAGLWKFIPKEKIYDFLPELSQNIIKFIKKNNINYDLFHGHYVDGGIIAVDIAQHFKKPIFFTPHSLGAWKKADMNEDPKKMEKKYNFKRRIKEEIRILKLAKATILTTSLQKEKLKELYNFEPKNIDIIPPGVDTDKLRPISAKGAWNKNLPEKYIFCLSRIDANKGHGVLLNAFNIVRKKFPETKLVIGGGSFEPKKRELDLLNKIKKIIKEKKLKNNVIMAGYIPDKLLPSFYRQATLFVVPSIFEPFAMTALEAMACETPIVASKFAGIKNIILEKKCGLLADPNNSKEFSDAIIKFIENPEFAKKTGKKGRKIVCKYFSWDSIAEKYIKFYKKYLD